MPQIRQAKKLPYSREQLFDLVADVEKYPEFLPWCADGKIIRRETSALIGQITVQKSAFRKSFTTRNEFVYPEYMNLTLIEGFLSQLNARWEFHQLPDGCEVRYQMNIEVPFFLKPILESVIQQMSEKMVDAFAQRAKAIYG